ncbi:MAG: LptE family protein [Cyclobacteriaceae bacterium]|nr:LptE family protein [Cyclobacteriaceae bacterium]
MSKLHLFLIVPFLFVATSCGVYSFTGTTITAKTISIQTFYNDANNGPTNLGALFTDKLRDYYQQNTSLSQVPDDGELQIEGSVTGYKLTPVAPSAASSTETNDQANLTRLTITVKVSYVNLEDEEQNFNNKSFSFYADFDNDQGLTAVENQLIQEIYDQIILDIFNATVANW